ncbi:MAG: c-type cytochrome [Rhodanobacteraceae bacterium]|nr:MAG: c-type cytochrome [Rhodanobacteraceae bacterium]
MIVQNVVWIIVLCGIGLVALGFILVISQSGKPADDDATRKTLHRAHRLQGWLFAVLLVIFFVGSYATLHHFPIPPQHSPLGAHQVVDVVGQQWSWQIKPDTVRTGSVVEFRVTSKDVNHGFALYAPDDRIVTQTQAMPGYTNKVLYTFTHPGVYKVQCLEYCGLMHAEMTKTLQVVAAGQTVASTQGAAGGNGEASTAALGAKVFNDNCAVCHQASGKGVPNVFPPLAGNPVVTAKDPTEHIEIVLNGTQGKPINGVTYAAQMPGWGSQLTDEEIAAAINHERTSWGNHAPTVTAKDVAAQRKQ